MTIDHLPDDVLVRRADGELDPAEVDAVERHLAGCIPCRRGLAEIEELSRRFTAAVALVDPPASGRVVERPSPRWRISPAWRVAAAIALTAGVGLALPPVRGWVVERLGLGTVPVMESPTPGADVEPGPAPSPGLRVAFLPRGDRFVIRVTSPQRGGALALAAAPGDEASAEIVGPDGAAAELLVLPDGLAIRNRPSATADYRIAVPLAISEIEVRIGDRIAWAGPPRLLEGRPLSLPLGPESR